VKSYGDDALSLKAIQKLATQFRARQNDVEDDERSGTPAQTDLRNAILRFLERNPHSSSGNVRKALFTPKMIICRLFTDLGLRFYKTCWIPHRLSEEQRADRVARSQDMLQMMKDLGSKQQKNLITGDESWISWDNHHRGMLAHDREDVLANSRRMISSKNDAIGVFLAH
jgi:hypothetical protein